MSHQMPMCLPERSFEHTYTRMSYLCASLCTGPTQPGENGTATLVTFLTAGCTAPEASALLVDEDGRFTLTAKPEGEDGEFLLPAEGVAALDFRVQVQPDCDNQVGEERIGRWAVPLRLLTP
jgi:hypothetical protein